jgi:hypothetical protein
MGSKTINKILTSAIAGTTAMTLFSYIVSDSKKENFREPEVLAKMIKKLVPQTEKETAQLEGWLTHYGIGLLFCLMYVYLWKNRIYPTLKSGLLLGAASGGLGIAAWHLTFKAHPNPPFKNLKKYYGHLFLAHLIFGAFAVTGNNLIREKNAS